MGKILWIKVKIIRDVNNLEIIGEEIVIERTVYPVGNLKLLYYVGNEIHTDLHKLYEKVGKQRIHTLDELAFDDLCKKYQMKPDMVIIDGNFIPEIDSKAEFVIKGDWTLAELNALASGVTAYTNEEVKAYIEDSSAWEVGE